MKQSCIFIGFGKQAQEYANVFNKLDIKISSIFVRNKKKYYKFKKKFSIDRIDTNLVTCLTKSNYDFVMVMLPWDKIEKILPNVIKISKKKFIFSEKPVALSKKSLTKLINLSLLHKKKLYVLYNRRFYDVFKIVKKFLKKNQLLSFKMIINEKEKEISKKKSKKIIGNIKYHITSHWIDLVMWLFNIKNFKINSQNDVYNLIPKKDYLINLNYDGDKPISMYFNFKNFSLKTYSLEKLYLIKNHKKKLIINEKVSNFKPGIFNIAKSIILLINSKKISTKIPLINDLKDLYNVLGKIKK